MGAHLSTVQSTLKERFQMCDAEGKGYLVSDAAVAVATGYWLARMLMLNCCHVAAVVLHAADTQPDDGHAAAVWSEQLSSWCAVHDRQVGSAADMQSQQHDSRTRNDLVQLFGLSAGLASMPGSS